LNTKLEQQRREIDHARDVVERDVKKQFEQAAWLAESVLDAAKAKAAAEARQAQQQFDERQEKLTDIERKAREQVDQLRQAVPQIAGDGPAPIEPAAADAACNEAIDSAEAALKRLSRLFLPGLFRGIGPFLWPVVIIGAAVGVAHVMTQGEPNGE